MPYINEKTREYYRGPLQIILDQIEGLHPGVGDLNYIITKICLAYLAGTKESYAEYNNLIGVLECAKQELYRRRILKYEDKKIEENGDVY